MDVREYTLRAEARAVEEGHRAIALEGDRFRVVSDTYFDVDYTVDPKAVPGHPLTLRCSCPAGVKRVGRPVPCKHAALVARRLEREGLVEWRHGLWYVADAPPVADVADPFEGLVA